jgi:hypothetical protein
MRVRVEEGVVVPRVNNNTGQPLTVGTSYDAVDTVEEMFQFIEDGLGDNPERGVARYDGKLGHPIDAWFDPVEVEADDERGIAVVGLTLLPDGAS